MIAEFTAAMTAIKETASLAKLVSDAKTEAEVNAAVSEMVSKLTSAQYECMSLIELARSYQEETVTLKAKIAEFEDFKSQAEGYILNQLDSGTLVYSKSQRVGDTEITVHLCPHCRHQNQISILQPVPVGEGWTFHRNRCLSCKSEFFMNKNENYKPPMTIEEASAKLNAGAKLHF